MRTWLLLAAVVAGAATSVQAAVNAQLRTYLNHPMQATFSSFITGSVISLVYCLFLRTPVPTLAQMGQAPWWAWIGGLLGTLYVWSSIMVAPRVGVALMIALVVSGQMLMAMAIDHYGWLGIPPHPLNITRVVGGLLVVVGMLVLARS